LTEDVGNKLNLLNYQINNLIKYHFNILYEHWKKIDLTAEFFFSGYIISLFSSFFITKLNFIHEFWDVILVEKWVGIIKCLMFIIDVYFEDLIRFNYQNTLKFFANIKNSDEMCDKLNKNDFKAFVKNFKFNIDYYHIKGIEFENVQKYFCN
jgi:hypothetical protein